MSEVERGQSLRWTKHLYRVGSKEEKLSSPPLEDEIEPHRQAIEPWLSAVFQSEHLSVLVGSGFTSGLAHMSGAGATGMGQAVFGTAYDDKINEHAEQTAGELGRGQPNIEDQIRAAQALIAGLGILGMADAAEDCQEALDKVLNNFLVSLLATERGILNAIESGNNYVRNTLVSFLLSFASRSVSRERLNLFTTNYDRVIEFGCDEVGLHVVDRFIGALSPIFRSSRLDIDMHYNPPGIRGEPRYMEGVIKFTKLHGSIDWINQKIDSQLGTIIRRTGLPFGAVENHSDLPKNAPSTVMIYPNPAKDVETSEYPYTELFRDFSSALCRPNSTLVTYGYGFGDEHINRVIRDMLTIPSTHLVIISYDYASDRIIDFCEKIGREAQISLLIGPHFGDLGTVVEHYLPKPAIDQITQKENRILENRGKRTRDERALKEDAEVDPSKSTGTKE